MDVLVLDDEPLMLGLVEELIARRGHNSQGPGCGISMGGNSRAARTAAARRDSQSPHRTGQAQ